MCELSIWGKVFYPNYELKMKIHNLSNMPCDLGSGERLRFLFFTGGNGTLRINGQIYPLISPAVCTLNEQDQFEILSSDNLMGRGLFFHPEVINRRLTLSNVHHPEHDYFSNGSMDYWSLRSFVFRKQDYHGYMPLDTSLAKKVDGLMDTMEGLMENQPNDGWPCLTRSYLMELLLFIGRLYDCSKPNELACSTDTEESIRPILIYLAQSYRKKIKLEELTHQFHTNKTSLNEQFKKATGMPVMSYLISIRMQIACSILQNTLIPVQDIMTRVGFNDDAHFLRTFKKYAGLTPTEFRNMNCWMLQK